MIPPEFRGSHASFTSHAHQSGPRSFSPDQPADRHTRSHNWTNNPVELWSKEQVDNCSVELGLKWVSKPETFGG